MATRKTEPRHEVDRDAGQEAREARLDEAEETLGDPTGSGETGAGDAPWDQQLLDGDPVDQQDHPLGDQERATPGGPSPVTEGDNPYEDTGVELPFSDPRGLTEDEIGPSVETGPSLGDLRSPGAGPADLTDGFAVPEDTLEGANQGPGHSPYKGFHMTEEGVKLTQPGDQVVTNVTKGGYLQTPQGTEDEVTNQPTETKVVTAPGESGGGEAPGGGETPTEDSGVPNVENDSLAEKLFQMTDQAKAEAAAYKAAKNAKIVADAKKEMEAEDEPAPKPEGGEDPAGRPAEPEGDPEVEEALRQYGEAGSHYLQIKLDAAVGDDVNPDPGGAETGTALGYDPKDYLEGDEPHQGAGDPGVPTDGAIDYGPDDTDHDPDSGMDDPLPGQEGPLGPDTGWTAPEEDGWTPEDEIDGKEFAPYDDGSADAEGSADEVVEF